MWGFRGFILRQQKWTKTGLALEELVSRLVVLDTQMDRKLFCHCGSKWGRYDKAAGHPARLQEETQAFVFSLPSDVL